MWCRELLELADEVDYRLVYVVECRSWVHRWDDADVLLGSFEGNAHGVVVAVASPIGCDSIIGAADWALV